LEGLAAASLKIWGRDSARPSRNLKLKSRIARDDGVPSRSAPMAKTFFITTAIDYTNSAPHIGHAYEKILADVIARYHRLKGEEVFFLTGVDQHGQKVQQSAEKEACRQSICRWSNRTVHRTWDKLDVRYDAWAATTDPLHKKCVQGMLQRLFDERKIYKDKQVGFYSVRQEQFLTDKDRNEAGEFGPEWGEVEQREEENYYFKLSDHRNGCCNFCDRIQILLVRRFGRRN
jgi:methionyl-tRNA synthetase